MKIASRYRISDSLLAAMKVRWKSPEGQRAAGGALETKEVENRCRCRGCSPRGRPQGCKTTISCSQAYNGEIFVVAGSLLLQMQYNPFFGLAETTVILQHISLFLDQRFYRQNSHCIGETVQYYYEPLSKHPHVSQQQLLSGQVVFRILFIFAGASLLLGRPSTEEDKYPIRLQMIPLRRHSPKCQSG